MRVPSVIPSYELQAVRQTHDGIPQEDNGRLGDESLYLLNTTHEVMIPRYEIGTQGDMDV